MNKMIKLKRLHPKDTYSARHAVRAYQHNSGNSEYGYKDYRIRGSALSWNVYHKDSPRRLNPITPGDFNFKQAKEWLTFHVKQKEK